MIKNTSQGDISAFVTGIYTPDEMGKKNEPDTYKKISDNINKNPNSILYLSDDNKELKAADKAGCRVIMINRPGNPTQEDIYTAVTSFTDINGAQTNND